MSRIIFLGDPQQTLWIEKLLGREDNAEERTELFASLSKECLAKKPDAVFFLGDLVGIGTSSRHWAEFSELIQPLRNQKIPLFTAIGNHDYFAFTKISLRNLRAHFETFPKNQTWYSTKIGDTAVIVLDSNQTRMTKVEWTRQVQWYKNTLQNFEIDSQVNLTVTVVHHPPYTNSAHLKDSSIVQKAFVPLFESFKKSKIMMSGHVHGYEHFIKNDRHYVTSAGGGGPRGKLRTPLRHPSAIVQASPNPPPSPIPLHFCIFESNAESATLTLTNGEFHSEGQRIIEAFSVSSN